MVENLLIPSAAQEFEKDKMTVIVGNMPSDAKAAWIKTLFADCGKILSIKFADVLYSPHLSP